LRSTSRWVQQTEDGHNKSIDCNLCHFSATCWKKFSRNSAQILQFFDSISNRGQTTKLFLSLSTSRLCQRQTLTDALDANRSTQTFASTGFVKKTAECFAIRSATF
jgi:hypothetical protein